MKTKISKKQPKQFVDKNPVEVGSSIIGTFKKSVKTDLMERSVHDAWNQLTNKGESNEQSAGELSQGQELDLSGFEKKVTQITEQGRFYSQEITRAGERSSRKDTQNIEVKMQEILIEIKSLTKSSKQLEKKVQITTIEQAVEDPGVYHANWFEKILLDLRDVRTSVEDGLAWFNALRSKKKSQKYGTMAKKHGTSFTLSTERSAVTQTG